MIIEGMLLLLLGLVASAAASACWNLRNWCERFIAIWLSWFVLILVNGYLLSPFRLLSSIPAWLALLFIESIVLLLMARRINTDLHPPIYEEMSEWLGNAETSPWVRWLMRGAILWMILLLVLQSAQVIFLAPSHFDSFTFILPRTLFFLQNGSLERYFTLDGAQQMHATGHAQLQVFFSLGLNRSEIAFAIPSLLAYLVGIVAIAESGRKISGGSCAAGIFSAFIFATATNCLLMSTTAQSDLPIAACLASALCFLIAGVFAPSFGFIFLAVIALSCALTLKATALLAITALLPVILLALLLWGKSLGSLFKIALGLITLGLVSLFLILPAGYARNTMLDGHPLGSKGWRSEHELKGLPWSVQCSEGAKNSLRFFISFTSLDGFYGGPVGSDGNAIRAFQKGWHLRLDHWLKKHGIDLTTSEHVRTPFSFQEAWQKQPTSEEDYAYPGAVFILAVVVCLFFLPRRRPASLTAVTLIASAILYFLFQAFFAKYDPWRGRSFSNEVVFLAPVIGCLLCGTSILRITTAMVLGLLGVLQSASAVAFRQSSPLLGSAKEQSTLLNPGSRANQLTRNLVQIAPPAARGLRQAMSDYDWLMPPHARIGIAVSGDHTIYPFMPIKGDGHVEYVKNVAEGKEHGLDGVLFHDSSADPEQDYWCLGWGFRLWRKDSDYPPRLGEEFSPFQGLSKSKGLGEEEGPYGAIYPEPFHLALARDISMTWMPVSSESTLRIELSGAVQKTTAKIVIGKNLSREIILPVTPEKAVIQLSLKTQKGGEISSQISFSKGLPEPLNHREISGYIYKASLIPKIDNIKK